jgi:hypothetical protein
MAKTQTQAWRPMTQAEFDRRVRDLRESVARMAGLIDDWLPAGREFTNKGPARAVITG